MNCAFEVNCAVTTTPICQKLIDQKGIKALASTSNWTIRLESKCSLLRPKCGDFDEHNSQQKIDQGHCDLPLIRRMLLSKKECKGEEKHCTFKLHSIPPSYYVKCTWFVSVVQLTLTNFDCSI
ncbi:hypothetical protein SEVIR_6G230566v4 [Setaria viridis]|uniref:Uncharacterized protein n=1 Tax=Setaria viridis TaxID=4556 RepID=A0A4U6U8C0_SETVI|nr:hypothetical protein SEVIR_6G230566v2 [Setaria viridis]